MHQIIDAEYGPQLTARTDTGSWSYNSMELNSTNNPNKQVIGPALKPSGNKQTNKNKIAETLILFQ